MEKKQAGLQALSGEVSPVSQDESLNVVSQNTDGFSTTSSAASVEHVEGSGKEQHKAFKVCM
jgi:hypothetical protein